MAGERESERERDGDVAACEGLPPTCRHLIVDGANAIFHAPFLKIARGAGFTHVVGVLRVGLHTGGMRERAK